MTNTFKSGAAVQSGYYLNAAEWAVHPVARDGERLPEGRGTWRRVPTLVAIGLTPILGLMFLMFLPFIGFALAAQAAVLPVVRMFRSSAADLAATVGPGFAPGEAHLTGKRGDEKESAAGKGAEASAERLDALEREIESKRK
jgi:hypothetical protein